MQIKSDYVNIDKYDVLIISLNPILKITFYV